jgi:ribosomal protein S18 acetylase RimI-like enzyme
MPPEEQASFEFGPPEPRVREAWPQDRTAIGEAIGRAFFDDPVALYLFPNESSRRRRFGRFAQIAIDSFAGHGFVYTTDPIQGAAIWQAPSPSPVGFWSQLRLTITLMNTTRSGFFRAIAMAETMRKNHFREPHWYLAVLGTVPEAQGRGIGSAMMKPVLERCDKEGQAAYLESSKESNIPFYNRHGFEGTGEIEIEGGPTLWPMVRRPV